jgi:hypothetical protein
MGLCTLVSVRQWEKEVDHVRFYNDKSVSFLSRQHDSALKEIVHPSLWSVCQLRNKWLE